jgi:glycosyltransferase involved in cell wall biosynthesis
MDESLQPPVQADMPPLVTVALPVYNGGKYLRPAVLSIVNQTFKDWELLIIDDGSTDNALQSIVGINDARIRIFRDGKNMGLATRLNECIDLARGQYFARMDQDDLSYPERLECQVRELVTDSKIDLVATRAVTISSDDWLTGLLPSAATNADICTKPWRGFYLPHPTWMGRIAWFRRFRYAEPAPYFCEDQELLLRSYEISHFSMIMQPLFAYRVRDRVNWYKLMRTRVAVLRLQIKHFISRRQWRYCMLALLVFLGRLALDAFRITSDGALLRDKSRD